MSKTEHYYLIYRAGAVPRVVSRRVTLRRDEIAFPLRISVPDEWGRYLYRPTLEVELPAAPVVDGVGDPVDISPGE